MPPVSARQQRLRVGRPLWLRDAARTKQRYATPQFRPLAGRFRMYRTYVLATKKIDSRHRDDVGLSDVMVWDTERPYHYARWTPERRLLMGGEDRLVQPGQRRRQQFWIASRDLRAYFEARLPALATVGNRVCLGRSLRDHPRQPSLHRSSPSILPSLVRPGLRRQWHDLRVSRRPACCWSGGTE